MNLFNPSVVLGLNFNNCAVQRDFKYVTTLNALMIIHCTEAVILGSLACGWPSGRSFICMLCHWLVTAHCYLCVYKYHFTHNSAAETILLNSMIFLLTVWTGVSLFQSLIAFKRLLKVVWCMAFAAFPTPGGLAPKWFTSQHLVVVTCTHINLGCVSGSNVV